MKKLVWIAHPVSGDQKKNADRIRRIGRRINLKEPSVIPFAPYFFDLYSLDDSNTVERNRGISNALDVLSRGIVDEMRLYGKHISAGMAREILIAQDLGIPVIAKTPQTRDEFNDKFKPKS